ncbi:hypothetical protein [Halomontanus rarus]|uniref:hypothetical protein n=1 Tax=Halomontanus rarus TaxID=3034020 RepID=UPI0023E8289E|nr:hypothetical protein [Halovivax sp. TS33]
MNKELFGVFGTAETFAQLRPDATFDEIVDGEVATVGIRDPGLGATGWSASYQGSDGACLIWGENYAPSDGDTSADGLEDGNETEVGREGDRNTARWLLERYATEGIEALAALNGSYLAFLEYDGEAFVATDPVRSRECFYTDEPGVRAFGTDAAAVAGTIESPEIRLNAVLEFLHMGVILGEKTSFQGLSRLPIDSYLTPRSVESLERFVYDPVERDRESEYARELADRLERAIQRRAQLPGRKGLLLSSGYDSRTLLSGVSEIERCYTVGDPSAQEVRGAKRLASQYDADHTAFPPDERYLLADADKVRYSQGIKESLHIHHAGYTDEMDVDTVYHGLLCDTFFRGHFTAEDSVEVLGKRVPVGRPHPNPNPVDTLLDKFGYDVEVSRDLMDRVSPDLEDPDNFVREVVQEEYDRVSGRADSVQNALNCCGIDNQPSMPFHGQLSDNYFASFLAVDTELIDWHLTTPPEYRTTETFLEACTHLDDAMLRYQPPDRPRETQLLNDIEGFVRRKTPFLQPFEPPWPDRERAFEVYDLDRRLLPDHEHLYDLPARHKLRLHDVLGWMKQCSEPSVREIERLFEPHPLVV